MLVRWKHVAGVSYETGPWTAALTQNYQKRYIDTAANFAPAGTPLRHVAAYQTFDVQGSYTGLKALKLTLGVKNVGNVDPPYTNNTSNFLGGYDVSYADVRGRFVYGSVTYAFK